MGACVERDEGVKRRCVSRVGVARGAYAHSSTHPRRVTPKPTRVFFPFFQWCRIPLRCCVRVSRTTSWSKYFTCQKNHTVFPTRLEVRGAKPGCSANQGQHLNSTRTGHLGFSKRNAGSNGCDLRSGLGNLFRFQISRTGTQ